MASNRPLDGADACRTHDRTKYHERPIEAGAGSLRMRPALGDNCEVSKPPDSCARKQPLAGCNDVAVTFNHRSGRDLRARWVSTKNRLGRGTRTILAQ